MALILHAELDGYSLMNARLKIMHEVHKQAARVANQFPKERRTEVFDRVFQIKFRLAARQLDVRNRPSLLFSN